MAGSESTSHEASRASLPSPLRGGVGVGVGRGIGGYRSGAGRRCPPSWFVRLTMRATTGQCDLIASPQNSLNPAPATPHGEPVEPCAEDPVYFPTENVTTIGR